MGVLTHQLWLLAQQSRVDVAVGNMGSGIRERNTQINTEQTVKILLAVAVAFVVLWAAGRLWHFFGGRLRKTRLWLFFRLCRAHRLRWRDHWLLWQVAQEYGLHDPAMVFVQPDLLATATLPGADPAIAARLAELHTQFFALPASSVSAATDILGGVPAIGSKGLSRKSSQDDRRPESLDVSKAARSGAKVPGVEWPEERRPAVPDAKVHPGLRLAELPQEPEADVTPLLTLPAKTDLDVGTWLAGGTGPGVWPGSR